MTDNRIMNRGLTIPEILTMINESEFDSLEIIGCITPNAKKKYYEALEYFVNVNGKKRLNGKDEKSDNEIKGKALEDLVDALFTGTGGYFEVYRNIRNGTNEIDLFLRLSPKGVAFKSLIDAKYHNILCECKNYAVPVGVTYVGKFCYLMQMTNMKMGIMFSYHGLAGSDWSSSAGLTKKIYLMKEKTEEKICIIDFKLDDFQRICNGESIFQILDDKYIQLQLGIDEIHKYISMVHPNAEKAK